jgi:hypothetical protein
MTPEDRIATSTRTLDTFERGGVASVDRISLVRAEMQELDEIAEAHSNLRDGCRALVARWQRYLIRVKTGH